MLSVNQINVLGKGYTNTRLLQKIKDDEHLRRTPNMWSNGIFLFFDDVGTYKGKTVAKIRDQIKWEDFPNPDAIQEYRANCAIPAYPIEIGMFKTPASDNVPLVRFISDSQKDRYYNAHLVATFVKRVTDKGHDVRYWMDDSAGFLRVANGDDIGLLAPYKLTSAQVKMDTYHVVNLEGSPWEGTDINAGAPMPKPEPETAIAVVEPEPEPEPDPVPEEPTPEPEEKPKKKRSRKPKGPTADLVPFRVRFTFDLEEEKEEILILPKWSLDLNDTDRLSSPLLVGLGGLGDMTCMVLTLQEIGATLTDLEIDVYAEIDKDLVREATAYYRKALVGESVQVINDEASKCMRFVGWDAVLDDYVVCAQICQAVAMVARAISKGVGDKVFESRVDAAKQFCYDHFRANLKKWLIAPGETIFEEKDTILGYADERDNPPEETE